MQLSDRAFDALERTTQQAIESAVAAERERCAKIVRRICGESRHITLGDQIEQAILNSEEQ